MHYARPLLIASENVGAIIEQALDMRGGAAIATDSHPGVGPNVTLTDAPGEPSVLGVILGELPGLQRQTHAAAPVVGVGAGEQARRHPKLLADALINLRITAG